MPVADTSQTERIRRLRSTLQAVRYAECKACPELGPQGPTSESIALSRHLGQMTYYRQIATGAVVKESCCPAPASGCVPSIVQTDPTQLVTITNPWPTLIYVAFTVAAGRPPPPQLLQGFGSTSITNITSYIIVCVDDIHLTCNQSVTLQSPTLVLFTNDSPGQMILYYTTVPSTPVSPIILEPGEQPRITRNVTSYFTECPTPMTIDVVCDDFGSLSTPNLSSFHNNDTEQITITILTSYTTIIVSEVSPGVTLGPFADVIGYSVECPPLTQATVSIPRYQNLDFEDNMVYTVDNQMSSTYKWFEIGIHKYRYNGGDGSFTLVA